MYGKIMWELIKSPAKAIEASKKKRDSNLIFTLLVVEWILIGIAAIIQAPKVQVFFGVLVIGIVGTLFAGILIQIIFQALGGKGSYIDGLASVTYSIFPISFGLIVSSILILGSYPGFLAALFVITAYAVMSLATIYRSAKEFFKTDMITTLVGISVLITGTILGIYALGALSIGQISHLFSKTSLLKTLIQTKI